MLLAPVAVCTSRLTFHSASCASNCRQRAADGRTLSWVALPGRPVAAPLCDGRRREAGASGPADTVPAEQQVWSMDKERIRP